MSNKQYRRHRSHLTGAFGNQAQFAGGGDFLGGRRTLGGNPARQSISQHLIEVDTRSLRGGKVIEEILLDTGRQIKNCAFPILMSRSIFRTFKIRHDCQLAKQRAAPFFKTRFAWTGEPIFADRNGKCRTEYSHNPQKSDTCRKSIEYSAGENDFEFPIFTEETPARSRKNYRTNKRKFAVLNPAGGWVTKLWHAEKFGLLADRLWEENGLFSVITLHQMKWIGRKSIAQQQIGQNFSGAAKFKRFLWIGETRPRLCRRRHGTTTPSSRRENADCRYFRTDRMVAQRESESEDILCWRTNIGCRENCHRRTCRNWICMDIESNRFLCISKRLEIQWVLEIREFYSVFAFRSVFLFAACFLVFCASRAGKFSNRRQFAFLGLLFAAGLRTYS